MSTLSAAEEFLARGAANAEARSKKGLMPIGSVVAIRRMLGKYWVGPGEQNNLVSFDGGRWNVPKDVMKKLYGKMMWWLSGRNGRDDPQPFGLVEQIDPVGRLVFDFDGQVGLGEAGAIESQWRIGQLIESVVDQCFVRDTTKRLEVYVSRSRVSPKHKMHFAAPSIVLNTWTKAAVVALLRERLQGEGFAQAAQALDDKCVRGMRMRHALKTKLRVGKDWEWDHSRGWYPDWRIVYPQEGAAIVKDRFRCCLVVWLDDGDQLTPTRADTIERHRPMMIRRDKPGSLDACVYTDKQKEDAKQIILSLDFINEVSEHLRPVGWQRHRFVFERRQPGPCPCGSGAVHDRRGAFAVLCDGGDAIRLYCAWDDTRSCKRRLLWERENEATDTEIESEGDDDTEDYLPNRLTQLLTDKGWLTEALLPDPRSCDEDHVELVASSSSSICPVCKSAMSAGKTVFITRTAADGDRYLAGCNCAADSLTTPVVVCTRKQVEAIEMHDPWESEDSGSESDEEKQPAPTPTRPPAPTLTPLQVKHETQRIALEQKQEKELLRATKGKQMSKGGKKAELSAQDQDRVVDLAMKRFDAFNELVSERSVPEKQLMQWWEQIDTRIDDARKKMLLDRLVVPFLNQFWCRIRLERCVYIKSPGDGGIYKWVAMSNSQFKDDGYPSFVFKWMRWSDKIPHTYVSKYWFISPDAHTKEVSVMVSPWARVEDRCQDHQFNTFSQLLITHERAMREGDSRSESALLFKRVYMDGVLSEEKRMEAKSWGWKWHCSQYQRPGYRLGRSPLYCGKKKQTGKSFNCEFQRDKLLGSHLVGEYTQHLVFGRFNDVIEHKLYLNVDEFEYNRDERGIIRNFITNGLLAIEGKGKKVATNVNMINTQFTSNEEAFRPDNWEERGVVFKIGLGIQHPDWVQYKNFPYVAVDVAKMMLEEDLSDWNPLILPKTAGDEENLDKAELMRLPVRAWWRKVLSGEAGRHIEFDGWISTKTLYSDYLVHGTELTQALFTRQFKAQCCPDIEYSDSMRVSTLSVSEQERCTESVQVAVVRLPSYNECRRVLAGMTGANVLGDPRHEGSWIDLGPFPEPADV